MDDNITKFHRGLLYFAAIIWTIFGLGLYFFPVQFETAQGVEQVDPDPIRGIGGFLIGSAVVAWFSLRSGKWSEVRLVTLYLAVWNTLNGLSVLLGMLFSDLELALLPNLITLLIIGPGMAYIYWQRVAQEKRKRELTS
ncbi:MAG: hypothetical protein GY832_08480 [Chloroflexi bacterium]|nr:hypothetical protein [Chloroflexota bacterium]